MVVDMMQLRRTGMTWQKIGDDAVVLDLDASVYLSLNSTGRLLWERLAEPCTEESLADALVEEYGIDASRAGADVAAFIGDMRTRGLLVE